MDPVGSDQLSESQDKLSKKEKMAANLPAIILVGSFIAILLVFAAFAFYTSPAPAFDEVKNLIESDGKVTVRIANWHTFEPKYTTYFTGLIFYPGVKIDPLAYAPLLKKLAELDILCVLTPMPFSLAILNSNAATRVIQSYTHVKKWYIAGHSLGGVMAAKYALQHPESIQGLILLAAYPANDTDLSSSDGLKVLSIYGEKDTLTPSLQIAATQKLLPKNTEYYQIKGGNHAQFGYYGPQDKDGVAEISLEEQQTLIYEKIKEFLNPTREPQ